MGLPVQGLNGSDDEAVTAQLLARLAAPGAALGPEVRG